ncbi:MAG: hypothetical protein ABEL51_11455 [Salinibacter sp.]
MLHECYADLAAARHRLRGQELPEELGVDESELERPAVRAREVAARLETCAKVLRNASGEMRDQPGLSGE